MHLTLLSQRPQFCRAVTAALKALFNRPAAWWLVLGVDKEATVTQVKKAYWLRYSERPDLEPELLAALQACVQAARARRSAPGCEGIDPL